MKIRSARSYFLCGVAIFAVPWAVNNVASTQTVEKQLSRLRPFSADQIHTIKNKTTTGKAYFTQAAMRVEGTDSKGGKTIQIMRFDRKVLWNVMPAQKMYVEMPWANLGEMAAWADQQGVERESLGAEQVGEYHCEKFRVHATIGGRQYTSLEWDAKELDGLPVKTQDEKGSWSTEYRNVQLGPQDPSLFEIPDGYQKLSLGGFKLP
ncbi:MAG TPA: DUF4412 domain-containing protein [Candidatus Acidoferrum sp.]|nr:DUF4412 domain-containing protein [Candidatus Acidoferrum sp.]